MVLIFCIGLCLSRWVVIHYHLIVWVFGEIVDYVISLRVLSVITGNNALAIHVVGILDNVVVLETLVKVLLFLVGIADVESRDGSWGFLVTLNVMSLIASYGSNPFVLIFLFKRKPFPIPLLLRGLRNWLLMGPLLDLSLLLRGGRLLSTQLYFLHGLVI